MSAVVLSTGKYRVVRTGIGSLVIERAHAEGWVTCRDGDMVLLVAEALNCAALAESRADSEACRAERAEQEIVRIKSLLDERGRS